MSYTSIPQECPTRVSHKSVPQECPTRVSYKSVPQECPTRVSYKSVPQEFPTRVTHKSVLQECPTECPARVSYKSVIWTYWIFERVCIRVRGFHLVCFSDHVHILHLHMYVGLLSLSLYPKIYLQIRRTPNVVTVKSLHLDTCEMECRTKELYW